MQQNDRAKMDKRILLSFIPLLMVMAWVLAAQATVTNAQAPIGTLPGVHNKPAKNTNPGTNLHARVASHKSAPSHANDCDYTYTYTETQGTIVPGTDDTGNHCDDCSVPITLPFAYTLYDQTFNSAWVNSNGTLDFGNDSYDLSGCLPHVFYFSYTVVPYWYDLYTGDAADGQGVFTSVSGEAPNRIFNIEWRAVYCCSDGAPQLDFEVRLYEGQGRFDLVYGSGDSSNAAFGTVGVQRDDIMYTEFACSENGYSPNTQIMFVAACAPDTATTTPTETATPTDTPTSTQTDTFTATPIPSLTNTPGRTETRVFITRTSTSTPGRTETRRPTETHMPTGTRIRTETRVPETRIVTATKTRRPTETRMPITRTTTITPRRTETRRPTETRIPQTRTVTNTRVPETHMPTRTPTNAPLRTETPGATRTRTRVPGPGPTWRCGRVTWTHLVNATADGNTIRKTGGVSGHWDAGAVSAELMPHGVGFVQVTAVETTTYTMFGLNQLGGISFTNIDFALVMAGGALKVYEGGTLKADVGSYRVGDILRIISFGGTVRYFRNDTLLYTSDVAPSYPLRVAAAINSMGGRITNAYMCYSSSLGHFGGDS